MEVDHSICSRLAGLYSGWGRQFTGRYDKMVGYCLLGVLLTLSLCDMGADWGCYTALSGVGPQQALGAGPPPDTALSILLFINIIGTVLFIMEVGNAMTLMANGGHVRLPVEVEQGVVLVLEELPLAAINLAIIICRGDHALPEQATSGLFALINTGTRLYFYGAFKEYKFKYERTMIRNTLKIAVYVTASALWLMLFFTQVFTWQHVATGNQAQTGRPITASNVTSGVSLLLMKQPPFRVMPCHKFTNKSAEGVLEKEGLHGHAPWLIEDVSQMINSQDDVIKDFPCDTKRSLTLQGCREEAEKVRFVFHYDSHVHPYGRLNYHLASISNNGTKCQPLGALADGWALYYVTMTFLNPNMTVGGEEAGDMLVSSAWPHTCRSPIPGYERKLNPCKII